MRSFSYSSIFRFIYRYGNIPVTLLLSFYAVTLGANIDKGLVFIIPFVVTFSVIYFLNRHYLLLYKILPYKIQIDDEKMVCSDFLFYKSEVIIYYKDIDELSGGIFSGKLKGLMKVRDGKSKIYIGFFDRIKGVKILHKIKNNFL